MNFKKKCFCRFLLLTAMVLVANSVSSSEREKGQQGKEAPLENGTQLENGKSLENGQPLFNRLDEVSGLIIDRTITRLGGTFYTLFSQKLNEKNEELKENLTIHERPTALSGSIISVRHNDKPIYRTTLSPGRHQAKKKTTEAVDAVNNYLKRWQIERLLQDTFDLDRDEF